MVKYEQNWLLFKACIFIGHLFGQIIHKIYCSTFELFIKVHSNVLFYLLVFLRDNTLFLIKVLVDIIAYDLINKKFKTILIFVMLFKK